MICYITLNVEIILSIVIAVSTFFYTIINLMMWIESRASRQQKIAPVIIAYLKTTENHMTLYLCIKNVGEGYARDVNINFIKGYNQFGKVNFPLKNIGIAKNGFNIFPSNYELKYYIDSMIKLGELNEKQLTSEYIELEIMYKDARNKSYRNKYRLPFAQVFGQNYSNPPETYIGQIPYYLNEINKTIKKQ